MGEFGLKSMFVAGYILLGALMIWGMVIDSNKSEIFITISATLAVYFLSLALSKREIG